ncbi:MAG: sulfate reduction electron transfer complex DsrMKJOP subunit DsrM [Dehalococcoidia bacterium]
MAKQISSSAKIAYPLAAVAAIVMIIVAAFQVVSLHYAMLVVIPYVAIVFFIGGFIYRIVNWGNSPVPFNVPTVCGQEKSLDWIKQDKIESPADYAGVVGRMAMEIFLFRSLFRNSTVEQTSPQKLVYGGNRWLWLGGLAFHWSLLIILLRHLRFFTEPVLPPVIWLTGVDGLLQLALPALYITDFVILIALTYLFLRRVIFSQLRYISLAPDYLALFLILGVVISGILMRSVFKVDLVGVKELAISVITFRPTIPDGIGLPFYVHLALVCTLIAYFPFSKMMHAPGILFSPTRNLKNDSRMVRRLNPWNRPVRVHTYAEYENEFREPMRKAGLPLEIDKTSVE